MQITHKKQKLTNSCAPTCFAMIVGCTEAEAVKELNLKSKGIGSDKINNALQKRGFESYYVNLNEEYTNYERWLKLNSKNRILYLSCHFVSNSGKGRNNHRHHAIVASDGFIYDPAQEIKIPIEAYYHTFNRALLIKHMILIEK